MEVVIEIQTGYSYTERIYIDKQLEGLTWDSIETPKKSTYSRVRIQAPGGRKIISPCSSGTPYDNGHPNNTGTSGADPVHRVWKFT